MSHVHCSTVNEKEISFPKKLCSSLFSFWDSTAHCLHSSVLWNVHYYWIDFLNYPPTLNLQTYFLFSLVSTIRPNSQCYRKMKIKMTQLMSFIITNDRCLSFPMSFAFLKWSQEFPDDFVANTVPILWQRRKSS